MVIVKGPRPRRRRGLCRGPAGRIRPMPRSGGGRGPHGAGIPPAILAHETAPRRALISESGVLPQGLREGRRGRLPGFLRHGGQAQQRLPRAGLLRLLPDRRLQPLHLADAPPRALTEHAPDQPGDRCKLRAVNCLRFADGRLLPILSCACLRNGSATQFLAQHKAGLCLVLPFSNHRTWKPSPCLSIPVFQPPFHSSIPPPRSL